MKSKFNPDKKVEYEIVFSYWQDDTQYDKGMGLQASCMGFKVFQIYKNKKIEIDNNSLPWMVYSELCDELKKSFPRQERKIINIKDKYEK